MIRRSLLRQGSPVLFILCCAVIFGGFLMADRASCIRGQGVRRVARSMASDDYKLAMHAKSSGDLTAYRIYIHKYRTENVHQLTCHWFFPSTR